MPGYAYDEARFFDSDDASADVQAQRRAGFRRLAASLSQAHARSIALTASAREQIADLQFTGAYRVPFQYGPYFRQHVSIGAFVERSEGVTITDLDGRDFYDLTGSYGVNVFGNDFYKSCIAEGAARVAALGPVLGSYHPVVASNVSALCRLSGMDEVSFHMSGTEAVMQAVRLARYHTRRKHLVRFCGAYHGWWEDVQPGPATRCRPATPTPSRKWIRPRLRVLRNAPRYRLCPGQSAAGLASEPVNAPGDSTHWSTARRSRRTSTASAYTAWLQRTA